jgi:hypothetical protein
MMRYERELLERQIRLQAQAAAERERLAADARSLRPYVAFVDRVRRTGQVLRAHPEWVAAGVAVLFIWKPRRVLRAGPRLWAAWRALQSVRRVLPKFQRRPRS